MFEDHYSLSDEMDHEIVMHRNIHFGGSFSSMIDYYEKEGKGTHPEFEILRIQQLMQLEVQDPQCFEHFLFPDEEEKVVHARELYLKFQNLYDNPNASDISLAIADLILSEEEEPTNEIEQLIKLGPQAVQPLIDLLRSEEFYAPLSPGYGFAPAYAALALGKIGDSRAIVPLFQAMDRHDYFLEAAIIDALSMLGVPAKEFLLKRLKQEPLTAENTHAAIALVPFRDDEEVGLAALALLERISHEQKHLILSTYLLLSASGLKQIPNQQRLIALSLKKEIPLELKTDLQEAVKGWHSGPI